MDYEIITGDIRISEMQKDLGQTVWPEFMQHDSTVNKYWQCLYTHFLKFQFVFLDDKTTVGIGNMVAVNWQGSYSDLPGTGLDWAMKEAVSNFRAGLKPNLLVGVQILINPEYQNLGISREMLNVMKDMAEADEIEHLVVPVRPVLKSKYPLIPIENYINWITEENLPFDPWIRIHVKAGGKIVGICNRSMLISGSLSDWEKWSGLEIPDSGEYVIDKALVPVTISKENNIGTYIEPNVWILHVCK